jgi:hypothetical protein
MIVLYYKNIISKKFCSHEYENNTQKNKKVRFLKRALKLWFLVIRGFQNVNIGVF